MEKLLIGMPSMGPDNFRVYMGEKYISGVERAGGQVQIIPWGVSDRDLYLMTENYDGILLPGGPDIDPALYGRGREPACGEPLPQRDDLESRTIQVALLRKLPILGICRGIQMLNVALGGTLIQDLTPIQKHPHSDFAHRQTGTHSVTVAPGSLLEAAVGPGELWVNSMHHQAVDTLAPGLTVTARSEEGYVEAAEMAGYPFCLAVQWHPEHGAQRDPREQAIFDLFLLACRREQGLRVRRDPLPDPEIKL